MAESTYLAFPFCPCRDFQRPSMQEKYRTLRKPFLLPLWGRKLLDTISNPSPNPLNLNKPPLSPTVNADALQATRIFND
ncbi:hypothetical protein HZI31_11140 [Serratia fonticola]|uniref:hypothetical protein n=1 Tax=Serratia fonticola TaxID=47917 RepID=UPI0015C64838|nr:hypothetical protein [Serratia fonticola]NYA43856.1 hypothetical protein [Serratia fonticola]